MIIAVDFDGTMVEHDFPRVGQPVPGAIYWLKKLTANGARIILWTVRSGEYLKDAVAWCGEQGIELWGINENPDQAAWTHSPKAYAHVYIDDMAQGVPLLHSPGLCDVVDWDRIGRELMERVIAFEGPKLDLSAEAIKKSVGK